MKFLCFCFSLAVFSSLAFPPLAWADNYWYFRDGFSETEKQMLKTWVSETKLGIEKLVAPYPFDTHFVFNKRHQQREPVPWANTERDRAQGVHFYVDTRYALKRFQQDWTASHEISHLLIPWLGDNHRWFAEGFASYLQYPVMYVNQQISWQDAIKKLQQNFAKAKNHRATRKQSIAQVSKRMHAAKAYKVVYWGGALYFMKVDKALYETKGMRLWQVIGNYQSCCRVGADWGDNGFYKLVEKLDEISATNIFTKHLPEFVEKPGFPDYKSTLDWLEKNPPAI